MLELPTVLLRHETRSGGHFDWMIGGLPGGGAGLWTWRVVFDSGAWSSAGAMRLTELPPHRRDYLRYEGRLSGGRGWVRRADEGRVVVRCWSPDGGVLDVRLQRFAGPVTLRRMVVQEWVAVAGV
jgi:hypothetical protein